MSHEIGNARGWSSAPGCASLGSCGSRARGGEERHCLPGSPLRQRSRHRGRGARGGRGCPCGRCGSAPGRCPAGPRREGGWEREGSGTLFTPVPCLHGLLRGPAGGTKAAGARPCRLGRGAWGRAGSDLWSRFGGTWGRGPDRGAESPFPRRSCGKSCTRGPGRSGRERCRCPLPSRYAPAQGRTFPIKPLPRDVRGHRYLPAIKTNHSSAPLGVCHREKSPRCERAPSVLPFWETQIYFFRQVSSSSRPALSGTCQGRKPLHSCRGGILISGSPFADRAQPQASRKSMSSGDRGLSLPGDAERAPAPLTTKHGREGGREDGGGAGPEEPVGCPRKAGVGSGAGVSLRARAIGPAPLPTREGAGARKGEDPAAPTRARGSAAQGGTAAWGDRTSEPPQPRVSRRFLASGAIAPWLTQSPSHTLRPYQSTAFFPPPPQ